LLCGTSLQPDCTTLKAHWKEHFQRDFGIEGSTRLRCDDGWELSLGEALFLLKSTNFQDNHYGFHPDFYEDLRWVTQSIRFDPHCSVLARARKSERRITLCPAFLSLSLVERASTLVHEGHHLQPDTPPHVPCHSGPYQSAGAACDSRFSFSLDDGAYSADVYFLVWLKRSAHLAQRQLREVQAGIDAIFPARFNQIPASERKRLDRLLAR